MSFCPKGPADWVPSGARTARSSQISLGRAAGPLSRSVACTVRVWCSPAQVNHQHIACAASRSLFLAPLEVAGGDKSVQSAKGKEAGPGRGTGLHGSRHQDRTQDTGTAVSRDTGVCPSGQLLSRAHSTRPSEDVGERTSQQTSRVPGPESERR